MTGIIITDELNMRYLEAGAIAVMACGDDLQIVTVKHIDPNADWVVMTDAMIDVKVSIEARLCKLMVVSPNGTYPLKFNQWANAIRNKEVDTAKQVAFELAIPKFKHGHHVQVCSYCNSHFLGAIRQPICSHCNDDNKTARIIISKAPIIRRPRLITPIVIHDIATQAYHLGKTTMTPSEFHTWLEKQL